MIGVIALAFVVSYIMLIWLRTNAFVEYLTLFGLTKYFRVDEFNNLHREGYDGNYVDFLFQYYKDSFLVRLVSCPVCLSFWLGMPTALWLQSLEATLLSPLILLFYLLFNRML